MKARLIYFIFQFCALVYTQSAFSAIPAKFGGNDVVTKQPFTISMSDTETRKALVIVFLSAKCPCSDSHVSELKNLADQYKNFEFIAVHSNTDEPEDMTKEYFSKAKLPFPVIQDPQAKLADEFKAYKTPHVFVLNNAGKILYQGGVSDSKKFDKSDQKFLREAIEDLQANREIKTPFGRTLGCAISRGDKHVW